MKQEYIKLREDQIELLIPFSKNRFTARNFAKYHKMRISKSRSMLEDLMERHILNFTYDVGTKNHYEMLKYYVVPFGLKRQITKYVKEHGIVVRA